MTQYPHDNSYKNFFSHPEMVSALLSGFIDPALIEHFDMHTLEKRGGSYVTDDLRDRENDIIWRVKCKKDWLYIYCWSFNRLSIGGWPLELQLQTS